MEKISKILGKEAEYLLGHKCGTIPREQMILPGPDFVDRVFAPSDRSNRVLSSLQALFDHGRLGGTGYLSILPIDQGVGLSAGAAFAPNPIFFDPENCVKFAIDAGCGAAASSLGVLGMASRKYAHKIPFIVKLNHDDRLSYPYINEEFMFSSVEQAYDLGAVAVGVTIYFGGEDSHKEIQVAAEVVERAHELGMAAILWSYLSNPAFKKGKVDYHTAADLTGQANHLSATIEADIIKQKLPTCNGGYVALKYGATHELVYEKLTTDHPIDLTRYQVINCYMGRVGLISSGGPASGGNDMFESVKIAVINKRAGGMGLILGRKAFQQPVKKGIQILNAIQDVYLSEEVTIA